MTSLMFTVVGTPAPQGSKRHVGNGVMVESSKKVKPWRQDVKAAALDARGDFPTMTGPVEVWVSFQFCRPKSHYRTGRNAHLLRDDAPHYVTTRPDVDKCLRSTLDALGEAGCWRDDAQVCVGGMEKSYTEDLAGAFIRITDLTKENTL